MIEIRHLRKEYEEATPLQDVNTVIREGDVIAVIGPSGTGKSTLLRCMNLLEKPTAGQIFFDGEEITAEGYDITKARRKMGMVFQSFNLFGHLTVIENLMVPQIDLLGKSRQEAYDTGVALLRRVGLGGRELQYPDQLSGGQKQRVAIARTLAMDPDVILFDEPTSALDPTMVGEVQAVIRDLAAGGKTMLIVTHEMRFARTVSNRIFYMDKGGICEDGTPEQIFENPQKEETRRFIRQLKVLELVVQSRDFDFPEATAQIDRYAAQNEIDARTRYRIQLVLEELVKQILGHLWGETPIHMLVEYADANAEVRVTYGGAPFDPAESAEELSYTLLKNAMAGFTYTYREAEELPNEVTITIG